VSEKLLNQANRSLARDFLLFFFEPQLRAWRGEETLGKVFWVYGVSFSFAFFLLYASAIFEDRIMTQQMLLIGFAGYMIWILVSVWRCAANARPLWDLFARRLTVAWAANMSLVVFFLQFQLITNYIGN
jgi:hypothetical protein